MSKARLIGPAGMSGMTALRGASSLIRSIRRGTINITGATSNTATLSPPVDLDNAVVRYLGHTSDNVGQTSAQALIQLVLTNATTLTATVATSPAGTNTALSYEVIEYAPGVIKSVQRRQTTASATSDTITAVDPNKSQVDYLGGTDTTATTTLVRDAKVTLTNATTVGISYGVSSGAQTVSYQVVEWF